MRFPSWVVANCCSRLVGEPNCPSELLTTICDTLRLPAPNLRPPRPRFAVGGRPPGFLLGVEFGGLAGCITFLGVRLVVARTWWTGDSALWASLTHSSEGKGLLLFVWPRNLAGVFLILVDFLCV